MPDGDRRQSAPAKHTSFKITKGTPLSEVVAAATAAGIDSDSIAAFATTTLTKSRRVTKARRAVSDVLHKAQDFSTADALAVIVERAAERAVAKAKLAEIFDTEVPVTEVERLSAALVLKARHAERHETTGRFVPKPSPTPGPEPDMFGGAPTHDIPHGTGPANAAVDTPNPAFPTIWRHGGASLLG